MTGATSTWRDQVWALAPDPILVLDTEFRVEQVNRAAARLVDATPVSTIGALAWDVLVVNAEAEFESHLRAVRDDGTSRQFSATMRRDGRSYWATTYAIPDGVVVWLCAIAAMEPTAAIPRPAPAQADVLLKTRRLLEQAQRIAQMGTWSWDIRSNAVAWSDEMLRILGYDRAHVTPSLELVLQAAVDEARRDEFLAHVQRALEGTGAYDFELPLCRADGVIRVVRTLGEVERDADGQPLRMTGTVEDVTERRKAEEALRRSELELVRAQRMAKVGSFNRSLATGEMWWTPTLCAMLELATDASPSLQAVTSRFAQADIDRYRDLVERALATGTSYEHDAMATLPSGRRLIVRLRIEVDYDEGGQASSLHGVLADITEQQEQEQALRVSEERFRRLWDASPIGIRLTDATGMTLYANPRLLNIFDCGFEEFRTGRWRDRIHADDRHRIDAEGQDFVEHLSDKRLEYRVVRRDGSVRYVRATLAAMHGADGGFAGHVGALEDLTEENEARQEKDRLELQMHQAQKLESLGVLAGGIAHDFNNLLVGVLTNASMALMDLDPTSAVHATVRNIEQAAQRAADLTRQLLAYSGKGRFIIEPLSLSELALEMMQLLRTVVSKRAGLHPDLQHDLPLVRGDATQLRQVVMNLITNASDSLSDQDGEILIRTSLVTAPAIPRDGVSFGQPLGAGAYVLLEVVDNGAGMSRDTMLRMFDPFFTTKFTGRGLGLAATIGIVRGHDGAICVRSSLGEGTTFAIYLPAYGDVRRASEQRLPARTAGLGSILVVDDDEGVRAVARALLQRKGFDVLLAANGQEGVELFTAHRAAIRVVLLDLTMPVMGGEEALRGLRGLDPAVRVVLMSGYSDAAVEGAFAGVRLSGFLQKPFRADDVNRAIALALAEP